MGTRARYFNKMGHRYYILRRTFFHKDALAMLKKHRKIDLDSYFALKKDSDGLYCLGMRSRYGK